MKQAYHHNRISSIKEEDGSWTWEYDKVIEHFTTYYKKSLGTPAITSTPIEEEIIAMGPCLNSSQQLALLRPFTKEEIKAAIFTIPNNKSPGPDGYSSGFFTSCWGVVGDDICKAVQEFFDHGELPQEWNNTNLTLIPKVPYP